MYMGGKKQYKINMFKILTYVAVNLDCKLFMTGKHSTDPTLNKTKCKVTVRKLTELQ